MITDTKEKGLETLIVDWLRDHSRFALKFGIYFNNRKTQLDILRISCIFPQGEFYE